MLALLAGGCATGSRRTVDRATDIVPFDEPREYRMITSKLDLPIPVEEFRARFNELEAQKLKLTVAHFQKLVEWALVLRHQTIRFAVELEQKKARDQPLSGADLETLCRGLKQHLALRQEVLSLIYTYREVAQHKREEPWLLTEGNRVKATMLAAAGALVLYDNFAMSGMMFQDDTFLRRLANRPNKGFDIEAETLKKLVRSYRCPDQRRQMREALQWLQQRQDRITQEAAEDSDLAYLQALIDESPSMSRITEKGSLSDYAKYAGLFADHSADSLHVASEYSMNELSKSFGNTVGLVEVRKGKLYGDAKVAANLRKALKPLDVLLEKTPFRLTDKFIPGHFGHVAIWVGTPAELKALGLWEHPLIKPRQKDIEAGKQVLEALREGVVLNTLEHFLNVDDIAVLRLKQATPKQKQEMLIRAFRQLGKEYDFNFNVESLDKIVCSELAYAVYTHIQWPTEKTMGRTTISPDNVAVMALAEKPFHLIALYHDCADTGASRDKTYKSLLATDQ